MAQSAGALSPFAFRSMLGETKQTTEMSFSVGIQQRVKSVAIEASYVGTLNRHLYSSTSINPIPMYAHFDPANQDPTRPGFPLIDDFLRPMRGVGNVTLSQPQSSTNYNAFQLSVSRRVGKGLQFGLAYTFSKALGA